MCLLLTLKRRQTVCEEEEEEEVLLTTPVCCLFDWPQTHNSLMGRYPQKNLNHNSTRFSRGLISSWSIKWMHPCTEKRNSFSSCCCNKSWVWFPGMDELCRIMGLGQAQFQNHHWNSNPHPPPESFLCCSCMTCMMDAGGQKNTIMSSSEQPKPIVLNL